jgi:hypothetical protein
MDILKLIRHNHELIKRGNFYLVKLDIDIQRFYLLVIDRSKSKSLSKSKGIKSLSKRVLKNNSIVGGVVIVSSINSLMNRIQSNLVFVRKEDAEGLVDYLIYSFNNNKNKRLRVDGLRRFFWSLISTREVKKIVEYDYTDKRPLISGVNNFFINDEIIKSSNKQKDFEGHQEWNME